jgi:hypothetical protein
VGETGIKKLEEKKVTKQEGYEGCYPEPYLTI